MDSTITAVDVLIVGAGASGLTAALEFKTNSSFSYKVLEAAPHIGGRLQKLSNFTSFPIDIGGEWIHVNPEILNVIAGPTTTTTPAEKPTEDIDTIEYLPNYQVYNEDEVSGSGGTWTSATLNLNDYKFINYTWYDFFHDYIYESVVSDVVLNCQVTTVEWGNEESTNRQLQEEEQGDGGSAGTDAVVGDDYYYNEEAVREEENYYYDDYDDGIPVEEEEIEVESEGTDNIVSTTTKKPSSVKVTCADGRQWMAKYVVVTAPVKVLQQGTIQFQPSLPQDLQQAMNNIDIMDGLKVFMKFQTKFYDNIDAFEIADDFNDDDFILNGARFFYDETYGQFNVNNENILGFLAVGQLAQPYIALGTNNDAIIQLVLSELDEMFNGQASTNYITGFVQNWNEQPFIRGTYTSDNTDGTNVDVIREFSTRPENRIVFAGESFPPGNSVEWGYAHGAALSGRYFAQQVMSKLDPSLTSPSSSNNNINDEAADVDTSRGTTTDEEQQEAASSEKGSTPSTGTASASNTIHAMEHVSIMMNILMLMLFLRKIW